MAENRNDVAVTREFRKAAAKFATGITVVLVDTPQGLHGMTANAFMSVSLKPLTVAVSIANHTRMHQCLEERGTRFSISVLAHDQSCYRMCLLGGWIPMTWPIHSKPSRGGLLFAMRPPGFAVFARTFLSVGIIPSPLAAWKRLIAQTVTR
ncbi:MAG: flavin reductase family protein [Firmicutes bacterium]|nr:flavin reductase family protein [Bacillota bacterium]